MKIVVLLLILAICVAAYVRAQKPEVWNQCMHQIGASADFDVNPAADAGTLPTLASVLSGVPSGPTPVISGTLTSGPITAHSEEEANFLTALNAEGSQVDQMVAAMLARNGDAGAKAWDALDAKIDDFEKKMLASALTVNNQAFRGNALIQRQNQIEVCANSPCDYGRHREIVRQLLASPLPELVALGQEQAKPIDLRYTAVDGSEVDISKLRGKVVLVDFWAAWCGYCTLQTSDVVAAYNKYHPVGVEMIGISWDDNQDAMTRYMSAHGMSWPQYFFGDHLGNPLSKRLGVGTLPTLWLVDKHGLLINSTDGQDVGGQVEKALAEQ